ncbi:MAG: hypothetical protein AB1521_13205 [Bacteroidota bacterium]
MCKPPPLQSYSPSLERFEKGVSTMNEANTTSTVFIVKNCGDYIKVQFMGKRTLSGMIKNWLEVKNYIKSVPVKLLIKDQMNGKLRTDEISYLMTKLDVYKEGKVAIILSEIDSYNHRFFDSISKYGGLKIKHFNIEEEAVNWLLDL